MWWPYAIAAAAAAAYLVRPRDKYKVPVRQSWTLRALNALLWPSCLLQDYCGISVPRVGKMLRWPLSLLRGAGNASEADTGRGKPRPAMPAEPAMDGI